MSGPCVPGRAEPAGLCDAGGVHLRAGRVVVIGVGNEFRRDDGAGPTARLRGRVPGGVELLVCDGEPTRLIEAWDGAALAVVIDAVRAEPAVPGRLHRLVLDDGQPSPDGPSARSFIRW